LLHFAIITNPKIVRHEECPLFFPGAFRKDLSAHAFGFLSAVEIL